jgi:hypothetical protein
METGKFSRRQALQATAILGAVLLLPTNKLEAMTPAPAKTPALTPEEIAAIETAIGKKGSYKEAEYLHTTPLPRNDLKMTVKGAPIPIPFGFGGWVSFKKSIDGKTAMVMGDTVLLQEEVNLMISAALANGPEISAIHNHFFTKNQGFFICIFKGWAVLPSLQKGMLIPFVTVKHSRQINLRPPLH